MNQEASSRRVAVIGARGIGRHHANWWHVNGHQVAAIVGTGEESLAKTADTLAEMFGFDGSRWTDPDRMLSEVSPDIVDVCSPPAHHYAHVRAALDAGCDVLCEKPFIYDRELPVGQMLDRARDLRTRAADAGRLLGMSAQYAVGVEYCPGTESPERFSMTIRSPGRGRPADPLATWIDLGPHTISAAQALFRDADITIASVEAHAGSDEVIVHAEAKTAAGSVDCAFITGRTSGDPGNVRQISINGITCDFQGQRGDDGHFALKLVTPDGERVYHDTMRELIARFARGVAAVTDRMAIRNLELLLQAREMILQQTGG